MKYRQGFVSNSSTTSFCLYGVCLEACELRVLLGLPEEDDEDEGEDAVYAAIDNLVEKQLPEGFRYDIHDEVIIGRQFTSIEDEETGKQFKENTIKVLTKVLPGLKPEQFDIQEEAFSDY